MVNLSKFFKKEDRWKDLQRFFSDSFLRVKYDLQHIFDWVNYFKEKHEHNDHQHNILTNQLGEHRNSIIYLNQELEILKKRQKILETTQEQRKGQVRTLQGTIKGQVKDMSLDKKPPSKDKKVEVIDKSSLTGSQLELLNLLYRSDKPISYENIARILGKKEKSIRNLIYETREKGVNIKGKPIGVRTKGFYLEHEEKIKVSGR